MLALLQLNLSCGTSLQHSNTTGELSQALLQLLTVVIGIGVSDLCADLSHATLDSCCVACTLDDGGLVLGHNDLAGGTEHVQGCCVQGQANLFGNDLATGQDSDISHLSLTAVTEARSLHSNRLDGAAHLVQHQQSQSLTLNVLSNDQQRLAGLHDLLQDGDEVLNVRNLLVHNQDVGVLQDCFLTLRVGHKVTGQEALVEAHTLGQLQVQAESVGVLNGDDAFLADLLHCLSNELADLSVASGNRRGCSNLFLGLNFLRGGEQSLGHSLNSLLDAALEAQRVSASSHVAQALANQCLSQNGSGGGTVTCDVVSLLSNFLDELRTNLLVRILQLDFLRDRDTVVGDGGGAPRLLQHNVAAAGAEGHLHCIGEGVQTALKAAACLFVKSNELCHKCPPGRSDFFLHPCGCGTSKIGWLPLHNAPVTQARAE